MKIEEKLFNLNPNPVLIYEVDSLHILKANEAFFTKYGYVQQELEELSIRELHPPEDIEKFNEIIASRSQKVQKAENSVRHITKSGEIIYVDITSNDYPYRGKQARVVFIHDVTERVKAEQKLQQSLKEKQVLNSEIHHRVKNNLAIISSLLQMQVMSVDDPKFTSHLQNSQLRIHSMAIVHEMLYQSGSLSEIEIDTYLQKLLDTIGNTLKTPEKDIAIHLESDEFKLNVNQAIPCALYVNELVSNCFGFAFENRKKGNIYVSVSKKDDMITVRVKDDGIGLPEKFEEMRKTSLGMSLVENLALQLETDVQIDTGDWGTSFSFTFEKADGPGSSSSGKI